MSIAGSWSVIELDLSRYDSIATRFAVAAAEGSSFLKSGIETRNAAFNRMIDEIEQVAIRSRAPLLLMGAEVLAGIDPFDQVQLAEVIRVCRRSRSLSEAGRIFFSASRSRRSSSNDADRLRKYLQRYDLDWSKLSAAV